MPANYWIVDFGSSLVNSSFPYRRSFPIAHRGNVLPYLTMWVKTGYSSSSSAASVRINGTEIGKIFPRPWGANHSYLDDEAESFFFSPTVLPIFSSPPQLNFLEVVPTASPGDFVLVSQVTYHWLSWGGPVPWG
jgi:hypothetical protein